MVGGFFVGTGIGLDGVVVEVECVVGFVEMLLML